MPNNFKIEKLILIFVVIIAFRKLTVLPLSSKMTVSANTGRCSLAIIKCV